MSQPGNGRAGRQAHRSGAQEAKSLAIGVGLIVLLALLGSGGAGYAISHAESDTATTVVTALRDVGIIILALFSLIMALIWGVLYFGLAWLVDYIHPKGVAGLRWVSAKIAQAEALGARGTEAGIVRPLARTARYLATGTAFVRQLGSSAAAAANRPVWHE